jgi:hypothetical protein
MRSIRFIWVTQEKRVTHTPNLSCSNSRPKRRADPLNVPPHSFPSNRTACVALFPLHCAQNQASLLLCARRPRSPSFLSSLPRQSRPSADLPRHRRLRRRLLVVVCGPTTLVVTAAPRRGPTSPSLSASPPRLASPSSPRHGPASLSSSVDRPCLAVRQIPVAGPP